MGLLGLVVRDRHPRMRGIFVILFFLALSLVQARADDEIQWVAKMWLQSADCARSTGKVLVLCRSDGIVPLANENPGDDPGHALVLDIYSATTELPVTLDTVAALNTVINLAGIVVLAVLLFRLRLRITALMVLIFGPVIADQFHDISAHSAQLEIACLSVILPLAILGLPLVKAKRSTLILWIGIGVLCLSLSALFRQSIGLMGLAASVTAMCIGLVMTRRALVAHAAILLVAVLSYESATLVLRLRDVAYGLPPPKLMERHGISHNLYIGLGVDENPFGIRWEDSAGAEAASRAAPGVVYLTLEYYDALRKEYFKIVAERPLDIATVYLIKFSNALASQLPNPLKSVKLGPAILFVAAVAALARWRGRYLAAGPADVVQLFSALYICFFLAQGILFHYRMLYMYPVQLFLLLGLGTAIETLWRARSSGAILAPSEAQSQ